MSWASKVHREREKEQARQHKINAINDAVNKALMDDETHQALAGIIREYCAVEE